MPPAGPQQTAMVGLITGSEVYGALPSQASGRLGEYLNDDSNKTLVMERCTTEDVIGAAEVAELVVMKDQITYVQPWGDVLLGAAEPRKRGTEIYIGVLLRTRIAISGHVEVPEGMEPVGIFSRSADLYVEVTRAVISTPTGESRDAAVIYLARDHVVLVWEAG